MRAVSLQYVTLGDLIRQRRQEANLSLRKLAELSGVDKAGLSRLENGGTRRPELRTLQALGTALHIPYADIISHYIEVEQRPEVLYELLLDAVQQNDNSIAVKVALKFLESPHEDSYELVERLYDGCYNIQSDSTKLHIFKLIVQYSRAHGIQPFLAKGLLQRYLIECKDDRQLQQTYPSGTYILNYIDFLGKEEQMLLYYKLVLHAYNLMLYEDCIQYGMYIYHHDKTDSLFKAGSLLAISRSYYYLEQHELSLHYLNIYNTLTYAPDVVENTTIVSGLINGKTGNVELAMKQLESCLSHPSSLYFVELVVELLKLYLNHDYLQPATELLQREEQITQLTQTTPLKRAELAYYYRLKGHVLIRTADVESAFDSYILSAMEYAAISSYNNAFKSLSYITQTIINNNRQADIETLRKMDMVYSILSVDETQKSAKTNELSQ
ncbi:helix-turn-helix domain-containing protein [Paenibacillus sp. 481]|uniref:helix-turn-helix domain-containing protein n=1 Tax=Paenibacillus sp. 481 TaxID=2835869 RepID=UPI001E5178AE|nr:transcriptional regulator [Paenibacillus sp. 481]UHA72261.1 transcriptional regulator [Paenibacillus sp. 481]